MRRVFGIVGIPKRGPLVKPAPGTPIDWQHPLARGLVSKWLMADGRFRVLDSAGRNHGTPAGTVANAVVPPRERCLLFNGVDSVVIVPEAASLRPTSLTLAIWMRPTAFGQSSVSLLGGYALTDTGGQSYSLGWRSDFAIRMRINDGTYKDTISPGTFALNTWTHLAMTFGEGGNIPKLYANGLWVVSGAVTGAINYAAAMALTIGAAYVGTANRRFPGYLDDVCLYNRALNPSEIAELHADPYCMYLEPRKTIFVPLDIPVIISGNRRRFSRSTGFWSY